MASLHKDKLLRFVSISDTHSLHRKMLLPPGDVLIHAGDITARGKKAEVIDFLKWFAGQRHQYKIFVAGNHDFFFEKENKETILQMLPTGVHYLDDSGLEINGIKIWGSPVTPIFFNWAFNRQRGKAIRKHWELIPADTDLLITHGPVYGFLDQTGTEQHVGCQDLLRAVLALKPKVHVCGHIHESYGTTVRSGIRFINACVVNEKYDLVNRAIVFDI